ncbi:MULTISPECIES: hypothetical protein [Ruminococcus]|uniref:Uncharacterized protein n=1 Tax=Ruminococcus albus (strain ATCC 27210 / DSM 20455 / JCM 14654 / NCDO 2250 / 7) TaxID=697329 RepID=E6UED7_RUMA7|nr:MULTISPECIES: hypothetical protein [Ruminococcus]ADU23527.1 hypothetical protein Rumal_3062 [Ruminococcus albus 7 = DSM 20455]MCR5022044.1 hypothetical protein [Ruminococcus sp.]
MLMTLANDTANAVQNVFTPFPFGMHLGFCIVATIVYGIYFIKQKTTHHMLMLLACDLTFLTQINTSKPALTFLFIAEIVLLIGAAFFSIKYSRAQKAAEKKKKAPKQDNDTVGSAFED